MCLQTTSLPPSNMAGARAAIQYQKEHLGDRQQQQRNVAKVKADLTAIGIPVIPNPSHMYVGVGDSVYYGTLS